MSTLACRAFFLGRLKTGALSGLLVPRVPSSWVPARFVSTKLRRRTPSRMALSADVAQPRTADRLRRKGVPHLRNSPFGSMNQTKGPDIEPQRRKGAASEIKRADAAKKSGKNGKDRPLFKALKMQTTLSPINYGHRNSVKAKIAPITDFSQFPLLPAVQDAVRSTVFADFSELTPSPIQRLAIPPLLRNTPKPRPSDDGVHEFEQFLLAAETGSGKTLAYLLPVINAVKLSEAEEQRTQEEIDKQMEAKEEEKQKRNVFELDPPAMDNPEDVNVARPKALILVPTAELVSQVGKLVKQLSHIAKYRSVLLSSSYTPRRITNNLFNPKGVDIVVSTPHLIESIAKTNPYILSRVSHIVIDEADSLLDRSFSATTSAIVDRAAPSLKQLILCSATIPRSLENFLDKRYPQIHRLTTPNLHAIPRRVQLGVVDVQKEPYRGSKKLACADVIWSIGKAGTPSDVDPVRSAVGLPVPKHLLVFVNEREAAEEIKNYLVDKGIDAMALTRDTPEHRQAEILEEFTYAKPPATEEDIRMAQRSRKFKTDARSIPFIEDKKPAPSNPNKLPNIKVLVTTDLGSRGIDTAAVRTVILFDVPHTTVDFIHRLGRAGRMNRRGRGIILVDKKDRKDIVREVREAMFRGRALI